MLDIKLLRDQLDQVKERIRARGTKVDWEEFAAVDLERREALAKWERMKEKKNQLSGEIGKLTKSGRDATSLMQEVEQLSQAIREGEGPLAEMEKRFERVMLWIPNLPPPGVLWGPGAKATEK